MKLHASKGEVGRLLLSFWDVARMTFIFSDHGDSNSPKFVVRRTEAQRQHNLRTPNQLLTEREDVLVSLSLSIRPSLVQIRRN